MTKLISYIITVGGDTGWRFSNGPQWNSIAGMLLFDAEIWSMESIAESLNKLWKSYWGDRRTLTASTFSDIYDVGFKHIKRFIENNEGIYVNAVFEGIWIPWDRRKSGYTQFGGIPEDRRIDPSTYEVIQWELNGKSENNNYDK
jgi:hypothetical protein